MAVHENKLLRHTVKFRPLQVLRTEEISPCMRRVIVGGPALEGFDSPSPDDHVKLFFPNADGQFVVPTMTPEGPRYPEGQQPSPARDYTPRWWDLEANELAIDFVMHGDGVASRWAATESVTLENAGASCNSGMVGLLAPAVENTLLPATYRLLVPNTLQFSSTTPNSGAVAIRVVPM